MVLKLCFPEDLDVLKSRVLRVIDPILPIDERTVAEGSFPYNVQRTTAGRSLPEYYLCYFLFVDLLGFANLGQFEKTSWSVPIDYKGQLYMIEHRKMGLCLSAEDAEDQEKDARDIVEKITKAVRLAHPFFQWQAQEVAKQSSLNVNNYNGRLFDKFRYFLDQYKKTSDEADRRSEESIVSELSSGGTSLSFPSYELQRNAEWLALSVIDSFFSWTEHVFIHLSILKGRAVTGSAVADLADNKWSVKFKMAIDIENKVSRHFYDQLALIKRQIRNYMAHGAFGKRGEAFAFHSGAGAIPLLLPHQKGSSQFSFSSDLSFDDKDAIDVIERFIAHLWYEEEEPARIYIESGLPLILTMATDGTYKDAMESVEKMDALVEYLDYMSDQASNMDW